MEAKFPGQCRGCKGAVAVGDLIVYIPRKGKHRSVVLHDQCATERGRKARGHIRVPAGTREDPLFATWGNQTGVLGWADGHTAKIYKGEAT